MAERIQQSIDISEDFINGLSPAVLKNLLQDHSKSTSKKYASIFWATDNYRHLGPDYAYDKPITPELITGKHGKVVQPRVVKSKAVQVARSKEMAEVFTPSWVCNKQNNLIDESWFDCKNVFNTEIDGADGSHNWIPNKTRIQFPKDKDWKLYVCDNRLEITCGEGPYLASRYDTTTGEYIPIEKRIGILDRKLRIVDENTENEDEWLEWAEKACKATYGFEWQGDNLLLAREALLMTLIEYHKGKFGKNACLVPEILERFAEIISWNIWQMDGLKGVVPNSCKDEELRELDLFGGETVKKTICEGCARGDNHKHNGIYCKIKDWQEIDPRTKKFGKVIKFVDLLK
jgi:hypothetical protein